MNTNFNHELEDRLVRYCKIDTTSDETSPTSPSTERQYDLLRLLVDELTEIGAADVRLTDYGAVLAAYRIGDSPMNVIPPLMVYLPFIITVMQRYQKEAGIGTVIALMLPYTLVLAVAWIILFILWYVLGIPLGPGYGVGF